tara:strand:+ start:1832 stop:2176 length:345 start_codon:yes stop_codon:yes gene_type:complete
MGRPRKPVLEAKKPVTISLSPTHLVILDNLAKMGKTTRSYIIQEMLKEKGWKDLGLKAVEQHTTAIQVWPNKYQAKHLGFRYDPDGPKACNPYIADGKCTHSNCRTVYLKYGVV